MNIDIDRYEYWYW